MGHWAICSFGFDFFLIRSLLNIAKFLLDGLELSGNISVMDRSISETGEETIVSVGVNNIEEDVVTYCSASALESDAGIFLYSIFVMTSVIIFVL